MEVKKVEPLTLSKIINILRATHISETEKEEFVQSNQLEIDSLFMGKINTEAFQTVMKNRPLIILNPFKNSLTKAGDKKILADALGIPPSKIDRYIKKLTDKIEDGDFEEIPKEKLELAKTYVYRHGTKNQVTDFLDYELSSTKEILEILYRTLAYNTGGAADYFVRPIHRMDNKTLIRLYDIIDKNLKDAFKSGNISETDRERTAEWALVRIYEIQNNQKIKNAIKLKREFESI